MYQRQFPDAPAVRELIEYLFEQPYLTGPRAVKVTGRSKPAIDNAIETQEEEGIIEETTG